MPADFNVTQTESGLKVTLADGSTFTYASGDISFVTTGAALVLLMSFGVSFLFAGLLRRKNALSMLFLGLGAAATVSVQFFLIGYSLCFADSGGPFIGNLKHFGFIDVLYQPVVGAPTVPRITYALFQMTFAICTAIITVGAVGERGRLGPTMVFVFLWTTLVYDPIARWGFSAEGWANKFGVLDFAGGGVVHVSSGSASLVYSYVLGKRLGYGTAEVAHRPYSINSIILGTVLMTCGWTSFNGASALSAGVRASQAAFCTWVAAFGGGLTWSVLDLRWERKWSSVSLCTGILVGLIAVTPASGYVSAPAALGIGMISALACNFSTSIKFFLGFDDNVDIFSTHAVGGFVGNLLTGIFASKNIAALDGTIIPGGAVDGHGVQIAKQLAYSAAVFGYSAVVTAIILLILDRLPWLSLRVEPEAERGGVDLHQLNELIVDVEPPKVIYAPSASNPTYDQTPISMPALAKSDAAESFVVRTTSSVPYRSQTVTSPLASYTYQS